MKQLITIFSMLLLTVSGGAQTLTLDSCKALALQNNKQVQMARAKHNVAVNTRKAARTKYLPHVDLTGGYMYSSRELSILNNHQKGVLTSMGSVAAMGATQGLNDFVDGVRFLKGIGILDEKIANDICTIADKLGPPAIEALQKAGNDVGNKIVDAFRTNTHHIFVASAMVTQPIYMGGAITAGNKMADIAEKIALTDIDAKQDDALYDVENAYWLVVSLKQKQTLADNYLSLVKKLNDDVHVMIREGVATRADGLKVDVAVNEAEMTKLQVDNALSLSKMYLCKVCGLEIGSDITLADEGREEISGLVADDIINSNDFDNRKELKMLSDAVNITRQQTKMERAGYLPQIAFTGGVLFTNPSAFNGFERKFKGALNVGVMMRMPVFDWGETIYKVRASKNATILAQLSYDEAHEIIELQVKQSRYKVNEACKKLSVAKKNIEQAEENLRCANIGFKEGVMQTTDVMAAQTAWLKAQTQKMDADIDLRLSETALKKALGK